MNTTIIYKLLSLVLLALAVAFATCVGAGFLCGERIADHSIQAFIVSIIITLALAAIFHFLGRNGVAKMFRREALCLIGISWILATLVGSIPYLLIVENCAFADALFESSSGLTTTGATAFSNFAEFPKSLLFWRSLSQWVGGLGVVVFFVAVLSSLGAGAKILFSNESSGTAADFDQGRIQQGAFTLLIYYLILTALCTLAYKIGGMDWFQSVNHSMTTIATGGFSTEANSIEAFQSPLIEWTSILFMLISGTTFMLVIRLLRGKTRTLRHAREAIYFYLTTLVSTLLLSLYLVELTGELPNWDSIRTACFQATSIMTTTGYSSADFDQWLPPAKMLLIILMFIGGCSGSTAGGIKIIRMLIAAHAAFRSVIQAFRPKMIMPIRMGRQMLNEQAINNVIIFLMLLIGLQIGSMLFVSANEPHLSFLGVFSSVQATLFNIGPGFEAVGPTENFQFLRSSTKIFLSLLMILGRLELYAIMVLFVPSLWKRFS